MAPQPGPAAIADEDEETLRAELAGLRLSDLQKRAVAEGADGKRIDNALDAENSKAEVIALIIAATAQREHAVEHGVDAVGAAKAKALAQKVAKLRAELKPLRGSALQRRAAEAGVERERLDKAIDADDAKGEITELIVELCVADSPDSVNSKTRLAPSSFDDVPSTSVSRRELGLSSSDDSASSDDPVVQKKKKKKKLIPHSGRSRTQKSLHGVDGSTHVNDSRDSMLGANSRMTRSQDAAVERDLVTASNSRPSAAAIEASKRQTTIRSNSWNESPKKSFFAPGKHAMLSYAWTNQEKVNRARIALTQRQVPCW